MSPLPRQGLRHAGYWAAGSEHSWEVPISGQERRSALCEGGGLGEGERERCHNYFGSHLQLILLPFASSSHHALPSRNTGSPSGPLLSHIPLPTIPLSTSDSFSPSHSHTTHPSFKLIAPRRHSARKPDLITQFTPRPRTLGFFCPLEESG